MGLVVVNFKDDGGSYDYGKRGSGWFGNGGCSGVVRGVVEWGEGWWWRKG